MEQVRMVTSRSDAKDDDRIRSEVRHAVTSSAQLLIEGAIARFGSIEGGFVVTTQALAWHLVRHVRFRDAAVSAVHNLAEEYRRAGWTVSYVITITDESDRPEYGTGVVFTFK